ncbi:MAG: hypothetical protein HZB41_02065 [Ignavibacteriae bacterium]|nr:hypothetical protein [Ignavibacteriota bacterium]
MGESFIINFTNSMRKYNSILIVLPVIFYLFITFSYSQDYPVRSGSIIFLEFKCNKCHSIKSQSIECSDTLFKSPSDLSSVGDSLNSEIFKDYLIKKIKLNNKKHPVAFKGKKEDLNILCNWLQNLSSVLY